MDTPDTLMLTVAERSTPLFTKRYLDWSSIALNASLSGTSVNSRVIPPSCIEVLAIAVKWKIDRKDIKQRNLHKVL